MDITIIDSGFVTGDFLKPIGYAGEANSRKLTIIHPHFTGCYYQILVKRYDGLYRLGIDDNGEAVLPPSLLKTATTLECQFVAIAEPNTVQNAETDTFVFKSNAFNVTVAQGLDTGNLSPVPTYEELQEMYKQINAAKAEVDNAKASNERILAAIEEALTASRTQPVQELSEEVLAAFKAELQEVASEYLSEGFYNDIVTEVLERLGQSHACGELCNMSQEQLIALIRSIIQQIPQPSVGSWLSNQFAYTMNQQGNVVGGR